MATRYNMGLFSNYSGSPNPVLKNILIKSMGVGVVAKNNLQPPSKIFLQKIILKISI